MEHVFGFFVFRERESGRRERAVAAWRQRFASSENLREIFPQNMPFFLLPNRANEGIFSVAGPVAQLVEPPAHNRIVVGSRPAGSTIHC